METISIFGKSIPVYGLLGALGFALGVLYLFVACKHKKIKFDDSIYVYVFAAISAIIGAKLFYLIIESKNIAALINSYPDKVLEIMLVYLSGGFVFYGGLLGALLGAYLTSRYFKLSVSTQLNLCVPVIPLLHGFGRIGCHIVGCCHGTPYEGAFAVTYTSSRFAPNNINLFPVQLCESIFDFILFFALVFIIFKTTHLDKCIYIYLISYSVARFLLEFLRGDEVRGHWLLLSTSQWVSILILAVVCIIIIKKAFASRTDKCL